MSAAKTLLDQLERHYIGPEDLPGGVFLRELQMIRDGRTSRADAVYLSFTRNRGWGIDVAEVKVSRADYLAELKRPVKAEAWWRHSSRFWIVSPGPDITPVDLLPEGWGLMCPPARGRRFKVWQQPAERQPEVDLALLIEIAKKMDTLRYQAVEQARYAKDQETYEKVAQAQRLAEARQLGVEAVRRLEFVTELEDATGIKLNTDGADWGRWPGVCDRAQFTEAFKLALTLVTQRDDAGRDARDAARQIDHLREQLTRSLTATREALAAIEKAA